MPRLELNEHLHRCVVYIDLNMVRAGVVNHPGQWSEKRQARACLK